MAVKEVTQTRYIKDKITNNKDITNDTYVTYLALLCLLRKSRKKYYINPTLLSYELWGKYPPSRQSINSMIVGIESLIKNKFIKVDKDIGKNNTKKYEWIIDASEIYNHDKADYFTNMESDELDKVLNISEHYGKSISLLRFYNYMLSTLHKKKADDIYGIGFTPIDNMVNITGLNQKTIYSYLLDMEKHELIHIYRPEISVVKKDGTINELPSTYGRFEDKDKVDRIGRNYEEKQQAKTIPRNTKNNRALSQKYVHIKNCIDEWKEIPDKYKNELEDIYRVAYELNHKYKKEGRKDKPLKDLSMFKDYEFYKGEY